MHAEPFGVTVRDRTLHVHGDVDLAVAEQLAQALRCCADNVDQPTIVVDLAGVTFMDSTGISALIQCHQHLEATNRELVVINLPATILRTFEVGGVTDYLNVRATLRRTSNA
jgi:anti-anti-sigma factor